MQIFFYILQQQTQIWKWQAYLLVPVYKPPPKITKNHPLEPCTLGMLASPKLTLDFFHIQQWQIGLMIMQAANPIKQCYLRMSNAHHENNSSH